ncbi:MAG: MarR family transcriptional regulator [Acidimicrobiia bacterium]|nr:MarR family transcriptional regulator [Acidimicrobiia bacterium]
MAKSRTDDVLLDERITSFGLFVEANRRVMRTVEASLRKNHELTLVEFEALVRLARSDDHHMSMSAIAEQMVLTSGGATRLVDRLVGNGLVERVGCPSDRRVLWAKITPTGLDRLRAAMQTHLGDLEKHYFAGMSTKDRSTIDAIFNRLRACGES